MLCQQRDLSNSGRCLNSILDQAVKALFLVLDRYTLADLLVNPQGLIPVRAVTAESR
jgi:Rrf2 family nitric oxide-sensitive transcriptional repressor